MLVQTFHIQKQMKWAPVSIHPTLLTINDKKFLIDCGYEETFPEFVEALSKLGTNIEDLYAVLISHDDIDHLGALHLFKQHNSNLLIYCSELEAPSVSGAVPSERLLQAEHSLVAMPDEHKAWAQEFIQDLRTIKRLQPDGIFKDGELIEGELKVIYTQGHTKGHVSFYLPAEETLIANDALVFENDEFDIANPQFTLDLPQAVQSVRLIKELTPKKIICYHGGVIDENVQENLVMVLAKYKQS
jgi:glyoxylase-like metal-dependent hydrolase (beta-lactamase superfamily II)